MFLRPKILFLLNPIPNNVWELLSWEGKEAPVLDSVTEESGDKEREAQNGEGELGVKRRWARMKSSVLWRKGCLLEWWAIDIPAKVPTMVAPAAITRRWDDKFGLGLLGGGKEEKGKRSDTIFSSVLYKK